MEVRLSPAVEAKLQELAAESGTSIDELIEEALMGHLDELEAVRKTLDNRYDDLDSGRVKPIDGEEAFRLLMERTEARRRRSA